MTMLAKRKLFLFAHRLISHSYPSHGDRMNSLATRKMAAIFSGGTSLGEVQSAPRIYRPPLLAR
jgi:hypothetical protein